MVKLRTTRLFERGFTLVELVIVMTVLLILLAIIVPGYTKIVRHAKEDTLREDLRVMRKMIDQYTVDKERAPQSLNELVDAGYLTEIPADPITGSKDTWEVIMEDDPIAINGQQGIKDVKSGSNEVDSSGARRYSDW